MFGKKAKAPKEEVVEEDKVEDANVEVVSELNCIKCGGLGLLGDPELAPTHVCELCKGSGKV